MISKQAAVWETRSKLIFLTKEKVHSIVNKTPSIPRVEHPHHQSNLPQSPIQSEIWNSVVEGIPAIEMFIGNKINGKNQRTHPTDQDKSQLHFSRVYKTGLDSIENNRQELMDKPAHDTSLKSLANGNLQQI